MAQDEIKIQFLSQVLKSLPKKWDFKKINPSVPCIKVTHRQTKIKCDISMTNGMAVHNSELLGHLFEIQPEAIAFYHFIKRWLRLFNIRFKGFTLTLLVLFFLQRMNYMPSIRRVQRNVPEEKIDGKF